jgi:hypothetical protein
VVIVFVEYAERNGSVCISFSAVDLSRCVVSLCTSVFSKSLDLEPFSFGPENKVDCVLFRMTLPISTSKVDPSLDSLLAESSTSLSLHEPKCPLNLPDLAFPSHFA